MNTKITIALSAAALALSGCELLEPSKAEQYVSDLRGHTAEFTFQPINKSNGTEYYYPNSNKVLYADETGACWRGYYEIDGDNLNYSYPNTGGEHGYFVVKKVDGKLLTFTRNGALYQTYKIISDEPVDCVPDN